MDVLPARLKAARKAKRYTQEQLGTLIGLDQSHISHLERGSKGTSREHLQALAAALGVTVSHLIGDDVREPEQSEYAAGARAAILGDYEAPPGLRELASDANLARALKITDSEWKALSSIELPRGTSKDGYTRLLVTIRAISKSA